jgi:hypothetical protein
MHGSAIPDLPIVIPLANGKSLSVHVSSVKADPGQEIKKFSFAIKTHPTNLPRPHELRALGLILGAIVRSPDFALTLMPQRGLDDIRSMSPLVECQSARNSVHFCSDASCGNM